MMAVSCVHVVCIQTASKVQSSAYGYCTGVGESERHWTVFSSVWGCFECVLDIKQTKVGTFQVHTPALSGYIGL